MKVKWAEHNGLFAANILLFVVLLNVKDLLCSGYRCVAGIYNIQLMQSTKDPLTL